MPAATTVLVANRGPVSFRLGDDGLLHAVRGGGGLVSGFAGADATGRALVVCAALSDTDRQAVRRTARGRLDEVVDPSELGGTPIRMLDLDPTTFARAYHGIANSTLWFAHHMLWSAPSRPVFDHASVRDWLAYMAYNQAFADAVAEEAADGARVLVQDYHLTLVPAMLRARRPDLRIGHFSHTPWAAPGLLPLPARGDGPLGPRGAARRRLGRVPHAALGGGLRPLLRRRPRRRSHGPLRRRTAVRAARGPRGPDRRATRSASTCQGLRARAAERDVEVRLAALREQLGDRKVLVRIDRTELSKNIVRGLLAFRELLATHPEWRERVVHLAFAYPSRHDLPEYRAYTAEVHEHGRRDQRRARHAGLAAGAPATSRTTSPARWRRTGSPTSCSSTRSGTG